jgi:hypothetical protein
MTTNDNPENKFQISNLKQQTHALSAVEVTNNNQQCQPMTTMTTNDNQ